MRWVLPLGFALVVILSACSGGDNGVPTASPTPTPSASATAAPSETSAPSPSPTSSPLGLAVHQGADIDLPDDMAMIIETGCWGCDGGPASLVRIYRDSTGSVQTEDLLARVRSTLPTVTYGLPDAPVEYPAPITGLAMTQDASIMAVSFCVKGACGSGGLADFDANSEAVVFRSYDGGITWTEVARGGPVFAVAGILADGRVLLFNETEALGAAQYSFVPDNTPVVPPPGASRPLATSNQLLWVTDDGRLLLNDGTEFYAPANATSDIYHRSIVGTFSGTEKGSAIVSWSDGNADTSTVAVLEMFGGKATEVNQYTIDQLRTIGWWSPAKDDERLAITVVPESDPPDTRSPLLAFLDLTAGVYHVVRDPALGPGTTGRTYIRAVQTGPLARVAGTGSCLNVRAAPSLSSEVLACMADGVLLRESSDVSDGWVSVMTPDGTQGWASLSYLER